MNSQRKRTIRQFKRIEKLASKLRLAADGWNEDWKILVATLMSARTTDKITIPTAERLFDKYKNINKLSKAKVEDIGNIIRPVNFYKTKARNILKLAKILIKEHNGKTPHEFTKLIELPGVGRKTANVFLAEKGYSSIGVDAHVSWISRKIGWTKHISQEKIESDLQNLFPKRYWGKLNWALVRFGQTYKSRKEKDIILSRIKSAR